MWLVPESQQPQFGCLTAVCGRGHRGTWHRWGAGPSSPKVPSDGSATFEGHAWDRHIWEHRECWRARNPLKLRSNTVRFYSDVTTIHEMYQHQWCISSYWSWVFRWHFEKHLNRCCIFDKVTCASLHQQQQLRWSLRSRYSCTSLGPRARHHAWHLRGIWGIIVKEKLQSTASDAQNREKTQVDSLLSLWQRLVFFLDLFWGKKSPQHCSETEFAFSVYYISACGLGGVPPGTGPIHPSHHQFLQSKAMQKMQLGLLSEWKGQQVAHTKHTAQWAVRMKAVADSTALREPWIP